MDWSDESTCVKDSGASTSAQQEFAVAVKDSEASTSAQQEFAVAVKDSEASTSVQQEFAVAVKNSEASTSAQQEFAVAVKDSEASTSAQQEFAVAVKNSEASTSAQQEFAVALTDITNRISTGPIKEVKKKRLRRILPWRLNRSYRKQPFMNNITDSEFNNLSTRDKRMYIRELKKTTDIYKSMSRQIRIWFNRKS